MRKCENVEARREQDHLGIRFDHPSNSGVDTEVIEGYLERQVKTLSNPRPRVRLNVRKICCCYFMIVGNRPHVYKRTQCGKRCRL